MGGAAALVHYPNGNYKLHLGAVLVQCVPEEFLTSLDSAAAAMAHSLASSEAAASWRATEQPIADHGGGTGADGNAAAGNDSREVAQLLVRLWPEQPPQVVDDSLVVDEILVRLEVRHADDELMPVQEIQGHFQFGPMMTHDGI